MKKKKQREDEPINTVYSYRQKVLIERNKKICFFFVVQEEEGGKNLFRIKCCSEYIIEEVEELSKARQ